MKKLFSISRFTNHNKQNIFISPKPVVFTDIIRKIIYHFNQKEIKNSPNQYIHFFFQIFHRETKESEITKRQYLSK